MPQKRSGLASTGVDFQYAVFHHLADQLCSEYQEVLSGKSKVAVRVQPHISVPFKNDCLLNTVKHS